MSTAPTLPLAADDTTDRVSFGERVRRLRKERAWTLADLSARCGLALSTISKVERGQMSLTYDRIVRLASGLEVDFGELFTAQPASVAAGAMSVTRQGDAQRHETDTYIYDMLCTDLRNKRMTPILGVIKAHSILEFDELIAHDGEEFLFVLEGVITVHRPEGKPTRLRRGDSIYFDSGLGHAYVSVGRRDAKVLVVCWQPPIAGAHRESVLESIEERAAERGETAGKHL